MNKCALYRFVDGDKITYPWIPGDDGLTCAAYLAVRHDGGFIERETSLALQEVACPAAIAVYFDHIGFWAHPGTCSGHEFQIIEAVQDCGYFQGLIQQSAITFDCPSIRELLTITASAVAVVADFTLAAA